MNETLTYALATLALTQELALADTNKGTRQKKINVARKKAEAIRKAFPEETASVELDGRLIELLRCVNWSGENSLRLFIDLSFGNPFAPYQLAFPEAQHRGALAALAPLLGLTEADADRVWRTRAQAIKAHSQVNWGRIAMTGIGGMIALAVGGWLIAPIVGTALGVAAGLSGAAATAHGLALLGGGSMALGGWGMAGGMWLITGAGGLMGATVAGGGTMLVQMGAGAAKVELIKLQVSFKEIVIAGQVDRARAQSTLQQLERDRDQIKEQLAEERSLNDANSQRIKDIQATLAALETSINWMAKQ